MSLLNAGAVRERAHRLLAIGLEDRLSNFRVHLDRMDSTAELVVETTRKAYPSLAVPFHSRWRHFAMNGVDRWTALADQIAWHDPAARARAEFDLAMVSVFLDAGAGPSWRYRDPVTGSAIGDTSRTVPRISCLGSAHRRTCTSWLPRSLSTWFSGTPTTTSFAP